MMAYKFNNNTKTSARATTTTTKAKSPFQGQVAIKRPSRHFKGQVAISKAKSPLKGQFAISKAKSPLKGQVAIKRPNRHFKAKSPNQVWLSMAGRIALDVAALRLFDVPDKARKLFNLLEQSKDPRFHALPITSQGVASFADTVNENDVLISKVLERFSDVSHLPIWSTFYLRIEENNTELKQAYHA